MWRVVEIARGVHLDIVENSLVLSYAKSNCGAVEVVVTDGQSKRKYSGYCSEDFDCMISECNPYGVVPGRLVRHFVTIDDFSWKFLDLVERVDFMLDNRDSDLFTGEDFREYSRFLHIDNNQTLFSCTPAGLVGSSCCCTLFQCACNGGVWRGDNLFLLNRFVSSGRGVRRAVYCLTFTDVNKARVLLGKAAFLRYNPIEDFRIMHT